MNLTPLLNASPAIQIHVAAALLALFLGAFVLFRKKGNRLHKIIGRIWVAAAVLTALSSFFIWEIRLVGYFSPIHLLSVATLIVMWLGLRAAMTGNIVRHKRLFQSHYISAFIITGAFTLMPGRLMSEVFIEPLVGIDFVDAGELSLLDRFFTEVPGWLWLVIGAVVIGAVMHRLRFSA